jgi:hypothetical protein
VVAAIALTVGAGSCDRCKDEETEPESVVPESEGGATQDVVNTGIGVGLGLPSKLAPTSTTWERVVVVDDRHAFLLGRAGEQAIALRTGDRGRTWTALKTEGKDWQAWGVTGNASLVFATGKRKKMTARPGQEPTVVEATAQFGPERDESLSAATPLFPNDDDLKGVAIDGGLAAPAALSSELLSLVVDQRRRPVIIYGVPGAGQPPEPVTLPPGRFVRAPFGRPAQLLSLSGGGISVRPWPKPTEEMAPASRIPKVAVSPTLGNRLDRGPDCDAGSMSFARLPVGPTRALIVGVSATRALAFPVPGGEDPTMGCHPEGIVVTTTDPKKKEPKLIRCTLDGKCADPQSNPFEVWPEEHERQMHLAVTAEGVVATMTAKTGARHGAYLSVSTDGGASYQLARVINEGETDRGFIEIGALVPFPDRVVMLISADVTGTRRRGWYLLASDDAGEHWGPP